MTDRGYRLLVGFYRVASTPLHIALSILSVGAVALSTSAVLLARALSTSKD